MNYLYSAFFCPPCQSLHDMYVYACMYIYDICIYMNVLMTATSSAQSLPVIMSVKKKWQKIPQWGEKMVTVSALCRWLQICLLLQTRRFVGDLG